MDILGALKWPLKAIDEKVAREVADKTQVAVQAGIKALPDVIEDLLNGQPVELVTTTVTTIQLRRKV